jgi:hypothetical protein
MAAVIFGSIYLFWWVLNTYVLQSRATQPKVNITVSPKTLNLAVGEVKIVDFLIQPADAGNRISALDIDFSNEGKVEIENVNTPDDLTTGTQTNLTAIRAASLGTTRRTVVLDPTAASSVPVPVGYRVRVAIKGVLEGTTKVKVMSNLQAVGPIPNQVYEIGTMEEVAITVGGGGGTPTPGNVTLNLKLKFQGVTAKPTNPTIPVKVTVVDDANQPSVQTVNFTSDAAGVFTGAPSFNLTVGPTKKFKVLVKGPKHLQRKVCDATPTETAAGQYSCDTAKIILVAAANNLDMTGITMLGGDLPSPTQDGIINSADLSLIRNNLNKTDAAAVAASDINMDTAVNGQDFSLVIFALSTRFDE